MKKLYCSQCGTGAIELLGGQLIEDGKITCTRCNKMKCGKCGKMAGCEIIYGFRVRCLACGKFRNEEQDPFLSLFMELKK